MTVGNEKGTGSGPNKKLAKRAAAENVLLAMGYAKPAPQPARSAIKSDDHDEVGEGGAPDKAKKVRLPKLGTSNVLGKRPKGFKEQKFQIKSTSVLGTLILNRGLRFVEKALC